MVVDIEAPASQPFVWGGGNLIRVIHDTRQLDWIIRARRNNSILQVERLKFSVILAKGYYRIANPVVSGLFHQVQFRYFM